MVVAGSKGMLQGRVSASYLQQAGMKEAGPEDAHVLASVGSGITPSGYCC